MEHLVFYLTFSCFVVLNCCLFVFLLFCQDLTAINVTKTGHRKKILSESAKLESKMVFPKEKPVSCNNRFHMNSWIMPEIESTVTKLVDVSNSLI